MEIKLEKSLTQFLKNQERIINHVYLINRLLQLYKKFIQVNKIMKFKIKKIWKIFINKIMVRIMFNLTIDKSQVKIILIREDIILTSLKEIMLLLYGQ